jgi:hypothetical protein
VEDPETRIFKSDPLAMIRADRGKYVAACLTIPLAYLAEGRPNRLPPLASYEAWSDFARSALVWLGCADTVETIATARESESLAPSAAGRVLSLGRRPRRNQLLSDVGNTCRPAVRGLKG